MGHFIISESEDISAFPLLFTWFCIVMQFDGF